MVITVSKLQGVGNDSILQSGQVELDVVLELQCRSSVALWAKGKPLLTHSIVVHAARETLATPLRRVASRWNRSLLHVWWRQDKNFSDPHFKRLFDRTDSMVTPADCSASCKWNVSAWGGSHWFGGTLSLPSLSSHKAPFEKFKLKLATLQPPRQGLRLEVSNKLVVVGEFQQ